MLYYIGDRRYVEIVNPALCAELLQRIAKAKNNSCRWFPGFHTVEGSFPVRVNPNH